MICKNIQQKKCNNMHIYAYGLICIYMQDINMYIVICIICKYLQSKIHAKICI